MDKNRLAQLAELDLLLELKRICYKNNISYFLVGESLIGAVRHKGFIPWDDDVDVGMLRSNYENFVIACKNELDEVYELCDWYTDKFSPHPFLKLRIKGSHYVEKMSQNTKMNDGIYIDVFPYDNAPDDKWGKKVQGNSVYALKKILLLRYDFSINDSSGIKSLFYYALTIISKIFSPNKCKRILHEVMIKYNSSTSNFIVSLAGSYSYKKELKDRNLVLNTVEHEFEGYVFSIPKGYHEFLRSVYGDYMKLPPVEEQISRHGILAIDLGSYKVRNNKLGDVN